MNKCPSCEFEGKDSDPKKYPAELIARFPKGFAEENHPKIVIVKSHGIQVQEFAKDSNNKIIFNKIPRCPACGQNGNKAPEEKNGGKKN